MLKIQPKFSCENCDFKCCKKGDWTRHIDTAKHLSLTLANEKNILGDKSIFLCDVCTKKYNSRNGLWKHKRSCKSEKQITSKTSENITAIYAKDMFDKEELIITLLKQNTDLMLELAKNNAIGNNNNNNNNNTNCNNKAFNLNLFLNETCKNAMNITEFVESIKIQLKDLERFGEVGYVEGLSNIITTNLKEMDVTERPVHCTDQKRETIYIKDQDKWEKEDDNKSKLRKVIKRIASKNYKLLPVFREKYPGCQYAASKFSDKYNKMMVEVMGGAGNNDTEKEDKIIHNISKNVVVDK
jgi:hypothetical protein